MTSTLLCFNPVHETPYSQVSRLSDSCLTYSLNPPSPTKQLNDCIDLISENRKITNRSQTRSNVEQILQNLVPKLPLSDNEHTTEGIILDAYANPYRFRNMVGDIMLCDNAFCKSNYHDAFINVSESVHYKFCLLYCTPSDTTSSGGTRAIQTPSTITLAESGDTTAIPTPSKITTDESSGTPLTPASSTIVLAKLTMTDGINPADFWMLLVVASLVVNLVLVGIILLVIILIRKRNIKLGTFSFY